MISGRRPCFAITADHDPGDLARPCSIAKRNSATAGTRDNPSAMHVELPEMELNRDMFQRSVNEQIAINQARTPTQRFQALCDLLDFARAMAPKGPEAQARRRLALAAREREKDKLREFLRRHIARQRSDDSTGV
jgi:hypothetical protein